jgi:uncharacterized protein YacL
MDYLFLGFVLLLVVLGTAFLAVFVYKLDRTPEMTRTMRRVNRLLLGLTGLILVAGLSLAFTMAAPLADWSLFVALTALAVLMILLAAQGFGIGFQQMDEDGVGFLRFFQLGSAIILCMSFVPAFIAFITYSTRLQ